jgi:hypothetical protein
MGFPHLGSDQLLPLCDEVESELNARKWKPKDGRWLGNGTEL